MRVGLRVGKPAKKSFEQKAEMVIKVIKTVNEVAELEKARPGLIQREVEVHRGGKTFKQKRWVRLDEASQGRPKKAPEQGQKNRRGDVIRNLVGTYSMTEKEANALIGATMQFKGKPKDVADSLKRQGFNIPWEDVQDSVGYIFPVLVGENTPKNNKKKEGNPKKLGIRKPVAKKHIEGKEEFKRGDRVSGVDVDGKKVSGTVTAVGDDGITVDHQFHVEHGKVKKQAETKKDKVETEKLIAKLSGKEEAEPPKRTYIPPEKFNAADYAKQWDDPKATPDEAGKEHILKSFGAEGEEIANAIRDADSKNKRLKEDKQLTHQLYRLSGEGESARYTPEREKVHGRIMAELLSPDKLRTALPPPGQSPKFIILGGRGGSGKSWFKNNLYDPATTVVLDADEIKERLPEYKGWNANQVHIESGEILDQMITTCIRNGLNVVLDATIKTADSALAKVFRFKSAGYKTEAHYMHCPKQEAAKRAIKRFRDGGKKGPNGEPPEPYSGRYVPVITVLENTTNEDSFDQVRRVVDNWSFRDSNGRNNEPPVLISEGKKAMKKSFSGLVRKILQRYY